MLEVLEGAEETEEETDAAYGQVDLEIVGK